jgi:DNA-binding NarL/FixJ family response regulator
VGTELGDGGYFVARQSFLTVVVGQNALLGQGLVSQLRAVGFRVMDAARSVSDVGMSVLLRQQQQILLIIAAGDESGAAMEQIELFKDKYTNGSIVVVADRFRLNDVIWAFHQGVKAYFLHDARAAAFVQYLELVMMGETIVPPRVMSLISGDIGDYQYGSATMNTDDNRAHGNNPPHLSDREKTIMRYLITGDSNKTIARKINIAEATVKVYIKAILRKIRVNNRTQAAIWAMRNDSIILDDKSSSTDDKRSSQTHFAPEVVPLLVQK